MDSMYKEILDDEKSIFKAFSSFQEVPGQGTAFWSEDMNAVPHWNLFYPESENKIPTDLSAVAEIYRTRRVTGHIFLTDSAFESISSAQDEYFVFVSVFRAYLVPIDKLF